MFCILGLNLLILSLPPLGLGYKSTSVSPGFYVHKPRRYNRWSEFLVLLGCLFGQMESMDVVDVLQEAGNAGSRTHIRSQV